MKVRNVKHSGGFTLIELLVSLLLASFIAVTSVGALRAVSTRREKIEDRTNALAELRFAARQVEHDMRNLFRTADKSKSKLVGTYEEGGDSLVAAVFLYDEYAAGAGGLSGRGYLYEVEYFLQVREDESQTDESLPNMVLMRRLQPNPNAIITEPGGIISVVAEQILLFDVRYYDGTEWQQEWPEEIQSYPSLIMVTLATKPKNRDQIIKHNFMMNFVRWPGQESSSVNVGLDGGAGGEVGNSN